MTNTPTTIPAITTVEEEEGEEEGGRTTRQTTARQSIPVDDVP